MLSRVGTVSRRIVVAAAILAATARSADAGHYAWTTSGPQPGEVFQILVNSNDSSRLSATTGYYGPMLFQSTDRGQSWLQGLGLLYNGRLVPDPSDGNVLYTIGAVGGQSGVLKSLDWGASWVVASSGLPSNFPSLVLALAPSNPRTLYAIVGGAPGQVYRTDDGAGSWALVGGTFPSYYANDVKVAPDDFGVLYADGGTDVFKSVDGGASWVGTGLGLGASRLIVDPGNASRVFAATYGSGVFVSTDAGTSWTAANVGIESANVRDLALDPHDSQRLLAATSASGSTPGGIFATTNAHDWSPVDLGETVNNATAVAIDPRDSSLVYAGGGPSALLGGFFQSSDGGAHWAKTNEGISGYFTQGVACDPAQGERALGISFARVFRTDDSGAHWAQLSDTGFGLTTLLGDPTDGNTLYAGYVIPGGGGEGVLKSVDGGLIWNPASDGLAVITLNRLAISPSSPDHLLAASYEGLFGTVNSGGLWGPLLPGLVSASAFDPSDPSILYAGVQISAPTGSGILRSPDGGVTWGPPGGIPDGYFHANDLLAPANDLSRVYALSSTGVFRSVDRGLNFAPANSGLPPTPGIAPARIATDPTQAGVLYLLAALSGGAAQDAPAGTVFGNVFRSTNGADSWTQMPGSLPIFGSLEISVSATGRTLYASTLSGIFQFERSYLDVPAGDLFWSSVDAAAMNGVTSGCGGGNFCPSDVETRAAIAVFLLRGKNGASYLPPPATGTVFGDVPAGSPAADYIEELFHEGVTVGCGGGDYCPGSPLSRAEASVLLLKIEHGSDYEPPPASGTVFGDVPAEAFAAAWIEQLALEGVTAGCGAGNFCPDDAVSRAQAAAFVVLIFGLS